MAIPTLKPLVAKAMLLLAAVAMAGSLACLGGGETLIIATSNNYPPFSYTDTEGKPAGFDVDYGELLCRELDADCQWRTGPFDTILDGVARGEFHLAINSHTQTEYRETLVLFSDPYYHSFGQFVRKAGSGAEIATASIAATQSESIYERFLSTPAFSHLQVLSLPNQEEAFRAVADGRADLTVADDVLTDLAVNESPFLAEGTLGIFERVGERIIPTPGTPEFDALGAGRIGVILPMSQRELLPQVNQAIQRINAGDEIDQISRGYFGRNITQPPGR